MTNEDLTPYLRRICANSMMSEQEGGPEAALSSLAAETTSLGIMPCYWPKLVPAQAGSGKSPAHDRLGRARFLPGVDSPPAEPRRASA